VERDEHVGRLHIAVNETFVVKGLKCGEEAERDVDGLWNRQRAAVQTPRQRFAFQKLHRQEQVPVGIADVEDLTKVRVVDGRRSPRLPPESFARRRVEQIGRDALERHAAFEPLVEGFIHDTHPAAAKLADNAVLRKPIGDGLRIGQVSATT